MRLVPTLAAATIALAVMPAHAAPAAAEMTVDRVVMLMRHGVRPPTKNPPMAAGVAADAWPSWPVAPGWLTPRGAEAVRLLGRHDRVVFGAANMLPATDCPASGAVAVVSDSDQRTIATGDAYIAGLAPGCAIANVHLPQDKPDPLFSPIDMGKVPFDAARARAAVEQALGPGGVAAAEAAQRDPLARIDRIYCGAARTVCGVSTRKTSLAPPAPGRRPKLEGALDLGSTAAQILLLEYADGWPLPEVGWGRASAADIAAVSALHTAEFAILARPLYVAQRNIALIAGRMIAALTDPAPGAARLTVVVGHDGNVASLGGLLDLHWNVAGFAADDPAPGGALGFRLLHDAKGRRFVQAFYRAQSLEQIRSLAALAPGASMVEVAIPGCAPDGDLCPLERFEALVNERLGDLAGLR